MGSDEAGAGAAAAEAGRAAAAEDQEAVPAERSAAAAARPAGGADAGGPAASPAAGGEGGAARSPGPEGVAPASGDAPSDNGSRTRSQVSSGEGDAAAVAVKRAATTSQLPPLGGQSGGGGGAGGSGGSPVMGRSSSEKKLKPKSLSRAASREKVGKRGVTFDLSTTDAAEARRELEELDTSELDMTFAAHITAPVGGALVTGEALRKLLGKKEQQAALASTEVADALKKLAQSRSGVLKKPSVDSLRDLIATEKHNESVVWFASWEGEEPVGGPSTSASTLNSVRADAQMVDGARDKLVDLHTERLGESLDEACEALSALLPIDDVWAKYIKHRLGELENSKLFSASNALEDKVQHQLLDMAEQDWPRMTSVFAEVAAPSQLLSDLFGQFYSNLLRGYFNANAGRKRETTPGHSFSTAVAVHKAAVKFRAQMAVRFPDAWLAPRSGYIRLDALFSGDLLLHVSSSVCQMLATDISNAITSEQQVAADPNSRSMVIGRFVRQQLDDGTNMCVAGSANGVVQGLTRIIYAFSSAELSNCAGALSRQMAKSIGKYLVYLDLDPRRRAKEHEQDAEIDELLGPPRRAMGRDMPLTTSTSAVVAPVGNLAATELLLLTRNTAAWLYQQFSAVAKSIPEDVEMGPATLWETETELSQAVAAHTNRLLGGLGNYVRGVVLPSLDAFSWNESKTYLNNTRITPGAEAFALFLSRQTRIAIRTCGADMARHLLEPVLLEAMTELVLRYWYVYPSRLRQRVLEADLLYLVAVMRRAMRTLEIPDKGELHNMVMLVYSMWVLFACPMDLLHATIRLQPGADREDEVDDLEIIAQHLEDLWTPEPWDSAELDPIKCFETRGPDFERMFSPSLSNDAWEDLVVIVMQHMSRRRSANVMRKRQELRDNDFPPLSHEESEAARLFLDSINKYAVQAGFF